MRKPTKCQLCHAAAAVWAMQYVAETKPWFYTLGSHMRGFRVMKVCDECRELSLRVPRREPAELINLATADMALALEELGVDVRLCDIKAALQSPT